MRSILFGLVACAVLSGCHRAPEPAGEPTSAKPPGAAGTGPGGVAPIGPNVGSITPVVGGDDIGGTGGGIAQAAKARAKRAASDTSNNPPADETGGQ